MTHDEHEAKIALAASAFRAGVLTAKEYREYASGLAREWARITNEGGE